MALDDLLDEHEQGERVRAWLRQNGAGLIGGIALGLAAIVGWKWWEQQRLGQRAEAAARFQSTLEAVSTGDAKAQAKVQALGGGIYRTLAGLALAKAQVAKQQNDAAIATLRGIHADDPAMAAIVDERLARLLIDAKQADAALKLLDGQDSPLALEVRGDAQFALGQTDRARASYTQALTRMAIDAPQRRSVELKLTQVGGTPTTPEARS